MTEVGPGSGLLLPVTIWMVVLTVLAVWGWRKSAVGAGLVLAYFLNLWLIHWPAAVSLLLPWYQSSDLGAVEAGLRESTYAAVAFAFGCVVAAPGLMALSRPRFSAGPAPAPAAGGRAPDQRLPKLYVAIGLVCYGLVPFAGQVPSLTALVSTAWYVAVAGICLACWQAWRQGRHLALVGWLGAALCLPFLTLVGQGFMSFGTVVTAAVIAFVVTFYRPRWVSLAVGLVIAYLALSFYVTYMRDRSEIRAVVWGGDSLVARLTQVSLTLSTVEWFNPYNYSHVERLDDRLNQNYLVGAAVRYLESGQREYAHGETLWLAAAALVPRALWLDKPIVAGSMGLVSAYTGIQFDASTSVGIGHVMDLYVNFGTATVVLGFLVLGIVLAFIDRVAGVRLAQENWQGFALWYVVGLSFMRPEGSLVEVTSSAAAAMVSVQVVNWCLARLLPERTSPGGRDGRYPSHRPLPDTAAVRRARGASHGSA
jgi:hypothetical protein